MLYNLHRLAEQVESVIVVEGFFGAIWLHQCGFPNVVALMGWSMSEEQETLLARFGRVALLLDGDAAGREASAEIVGRLVHKVFVKALSAELWATELLRTPGAASDAPSAHLGLRFLGTGGTLPTVTILCNAQQEVSVL